MQNIPVVLDGYRMTVVEPPAVKVDQEGKPLLTRDGVRQFVVHVFVKAQAGPGGRAPKGEEIKVTLETDPGQDFPEGARVALVHPRISPYEIKGDNGRVTSGLSFRAVGLAPATGPAPAPRPEK